MGVCPLWIRAWAGIRPVKAKLLLIMKRYDCRLSRPANTRVIDTALAQCQANGSAVG